MPVSLILAGGEGRRLGRPKGLLRIGQDLAGQRVPMIDLVVDALRRGGGERIIMATRDGDSPRPDSHPLQVDEIVADADGWTGPQAGLVAGLRRAGDWGSEWVQLAPCDVPFLDPLLPRMLHSLRTDGVDAIIPVSANGDENLLALVRTQAMLAALQQARAAGERSVQSLYTALHCLRIEGEALSGAGIDEACFHNVNSPEDIELAEGLEAFVQQAAEEGFAAHEVEVTETAMIANEKLAAAALRKLRQAGGQIALDDFGTGFSSLAYVHRLPIDALKVDRSFVRDLPRNEKSANVLRSILNLCENMGLDCIVEGVETSST